VGVPAYMLHVGSQPTDSSAPNLSGRVYATSIRNPRLPPSVDVARAYAMSKDDGNDSWKGELIAFLLIAMIIATSFVLAGIYSNQVRW